MTKHSEILHENAYAKVNLFLDVLRKREDGYHDLGTFFQTIGIHDHLEASLRTDGKIVLRGAEGITENPKDNLVYRAATALQERIVASAGADILLEKKLPAGAGLGGGSADAAATLRLLNRLWMLDLSAVELEKIAAPLGADIPFLVRGGSALAEGIGDRLSFAPTPLACHVVVATPEAFVGTKDAYAGLSPSGNSSWSAFRESLHDAKTVNFLSPNSGFALYNKFEERVFRLFPLIEKLHTDLRIAGGRALLSGSGASVFALFSTKEAAERALQAVCSGCRFSTLTTWQESSWRSA